MEVDEDTSSSLQPPTSSEDNSTPSSHSETVVRRTAEQVSLSAKAAGLTNTTGPVQLLHFSSPLNSDNIRLLEVPGDLLQTLKQGQK